MNAEKINAAAESALAAIEALRGGALALDILLRSAAPPEGNWIAAEDVQRLARELDVLMNGEDGAAKAPALCDVVAQARTQLRRTAPVQGYAAGIPWDMHLEAYAAYCKKWSPQPALITGWCRGGFHTGELDGFIPGWRERLGTIAKLQAEIAAAKQALAWISVEERMPPAGQFVLVKCPSGYSTTPFVYTTARRGGDFRPGRWIDHANDDLQDWGMEPTHWRALP